MPCATPISIVATERGGKIDHNDCPIRARSWEQVREIVHRFSFLNPYDRSAVPGSILKIEDVNFDQRGTQGQIYAYVISAKRYALFTEGHDGGITIVDQPSEHGLGH